MKIEGVTAEWDRPARTHRATLALAHGAGGDLKDELLRGVGKSLVGDGLATLRFNFPYRDAGRRAPGAQNQSEDCFRAVASAIREESDPLYCGGKSYGGRIATHIASQGFELSGLVLLSYPLHAPGRPDKLRNEHLSAIDAPMIFVQGSKDPFATPELLQRTVDSLERATLVWIDGGDHSLKVRERQRADVVIEVAEAIRGFLSALRE